MIKLKLVKKHRIKQDAAYCFFIVLVAFLDRLYNRVLNRKWTHKGRSYKKHEYNQEIENEAGDTWRYLGNNVVISTHKGTPWLKAEFKGTLGTFYTKEGNADEGTIYCDTVAERAAKHGVTHDGEIAQCWEDPFNDILPSTETIANAKLMAAAPELLKACEQALVLLKSLDVRGDSQRNLTEAIYKALK